MTAIKTRWEITVPLGEVKAIGTVSAPPGTWDVIEIADEDSIALFATRAKPAMTESEVRDG